MCLERSGSGGKTRGKGECATATGELREHNGWADHKIKTFTDNMMCVLYLGRPTVISGALTDYTCDAKAGRGSQGPHVKVQHGITHVRPCCLPERRRRQGQMPLHRDSRCSEGLEASSVPGEAQKPSQASNLPMPTALPDALLGPVYSADPQRGPIA